MYNKTKTELISSIHQLYVESASSGCSPSTLTTELKEKLLLILDQANSAHQITEEKEVTILLSDLRGFTAMSENYSPLEIIDLLNRYFSAMTEVIDMHGGVIDKFMGDSIMVVFGSPISRTDDLQRTLNCAIDMQIKLSELNTKNKSLGYPALHMGIGINTGQVVAGKLGSEIYSEYTVIGDHVNLASRVESYSLRGQILLSEHTYKKSRNYIEVGQVNSLSVKGKTAPIKLYELLAVNQPEHKHVPTREVRKSPRVEVNMPIRFNPIEGKAISSHAFEGEIIDLSYGGMYISTNVEFSVFTEIKFALSLSLTGDVTREVYAKILRANPINGQFHYHLEFSSIPEDAEIALKAYIDRIIVGI